MNRWGLPIVAAFIITAAGNATAHAAQSNEPTGAAAPGASAAQNSAANSSSNSSANSLANPSSGQTPEKKVWTNEELSTLDPHAGVSSVGKETNNKTKRAAPAKGHDAKWYHDQLAKLQAKIPPLDSQIAELQAGIDGNPTGDGKKSVRPFNGVKADDWSRELVELQKKREDTLAQIGALQDQARHNGIAANMLP